MNDISLKDIRVLPGLLDLKDNPDKTLFRNMRAVAT